MSEPNEILEQLNAKGVPVSKLAKDLNVDPGAIYKTLDGGCSRRIRVAIAIVIGIKPSELWSFNNAYVNELDDALFSSRLNSF